jgi:G3E family GTPase
LSTKIDIVSGFLGAGKTTLIKKLLKEKLRTEKVVVIENEFGEIGIDSGILRDFGIEIKEMNSGCICCSLIGNFSDALEEVLRKFSPDRIIIEPSGVGKLSGVIAACGKVKDAVKTNMCIAVVDAVKYRIYVNNFGDFFEDQIKNAKTIVLSRTQLMNQDKLAAVVRDIHRINPKANIVTTEWEKLSGEAIVHAAEQDSDNTLEGQVRHKIMLSRSRPNMNGGLHKPGHASPVNPCIGHNHPAEEVFENWGAETPRLFSEDGLKVILDGLNKKSVGNILRAKGIVPLEDGSWAQFDFVPGEAEIKPAAPDYTGRICVIGQNLISGELAAIFGV